MLGRTKLGNRNAQANNNAKRKTDFKPILTLTQDAKLKS